MSENGTPLEASTPKPRRRRRQLRPRPTLDAKLIVRTYAENLQAAQLAADLEGVPLAHWVRRAIARAAGAVLRAHRRPVPRRITDLAASGRAEELEQLRRRLAAMPPPAADRAEPAD